MTVGGSAATWDSKGNLTSEPQSGKSYGYSSENLLTSATGGVTLGYDPAMRLQQVAGAATTRLAYDGLDMIAEYDGSNALQRRFVFGPGMDEPIVQYEGSGTTDRRFLSADERGSIISLTDSSGTLLNINRYDEYGKPQSTNSGRFQYTGQKWIGEAGLYDYKARDYLPHLGIFAQPDPIGYAGGVNLYAYVGNDPINWVDPLGLCVLTIPETCGWDFPPDQGILDTGGYDILVVGTRSRRASTGLQGPQMFGGGGRTGGGFTCADALKETGEIRVQAANGSTVLAIGLVAATGTWKNLNTGTHGTFTTVGFGAGVAGGANFTSPSYTSLAAFAGPSDGFSVGFSIGFGRVGVGFGYSASWNSSGSGGGWTFDIGSPNLPSVSAAGNYTETSISNCKRGGG